MVAEIISVGTELLLGDILNTNAQYISKELASLGIFVYYQTVVGDNEERLMEAYELAFKRSDIIITSGGLGPTKDDLTKEIGAKYFDSELIFYEEIYQKIKNYFEQRKLNFTENNKRQAYFPKDCIILNNNNGTAPGCLLEKDNKMLFMLPGPPSEMIPMFEKEVKPILKSKTNTSLYSKTLRICGIGESNLEEMLKDILSEQSNPTLALYAKTYEVHLRITAKSQTEKEAKELIEPYRNKIYKILGDNIYGEDEYSMEEVIVKKLIENNLKLSVAESCTGGMLSSRIVEVSGVSSIFLEGLVTYSNESKIKNLNVSKNTLDTFGAVSKEVALEMAEGAANSLNADVALSTTGVAGPLGGTKEKPVGLVYIGLYYKGELSYKELNLSGNREKIRSQTVLAALDFLRRKLYIS